MDWDNIYFKDCRYYLASDVDDEIADLKSQLKTAQVDTIQKIVDEGYKKYCGADIAIPLSELQKMADDMKREDDERVTTN